MLGTYNRCIKLICCFCIPYSLKNNDSSISYIIATLLSLVPSSKIKLQFETKMNQIQTNNSQFQLQLHFHQIFTALYHISTASTNHLEKVFHNVISDLSMPQFLYSKQLLTYYQNKDQHQQNDNTQKKIRRSRNEKQKHF